MAKFSKAQLVRYAARGGAPKRVYASMSKTQQNTLKALLGRSSKARRTNPTRRRSAPRRKTTSTPRRKTAARRKMPEFVPSRASAHWIAAYCSPWNAKTGARVPDPDTAVPTCTATFRYHILADAHMSIDVNSATWAGPDGDYHAGDNRAYAEVCVNENIFEEGPIGLQGTECLVTAKLNPFAPLGPVDFFTEYMINYQPPDRDDYPPVDGHDRSWFHFSIFSLKKTYLNYEIGEYCRNVASVVNFINRWRPVGGELKVKPQFDKLLADGNMIGGSYTPTEIEFLDGWLIPTENPAINYLNDPDRNNQIFWPFNPIMDYRNIDRDDGQWIARGLADLWLRAYPLTSAQAWAAISPAVINDNDNTYSTEEGVSVRFIIRDWEMRPFINTAPWTDELPGVWRPALKPELEQPIATVRNFGNGMRAFVGPFLDNTMHPAQNHQNEVMYNSELLPIIPSSLGYDISRYNDDSLYVYIRGVPNQGTARIDIRYVCHIEFIPSRSCPMEKLASPSDSHWMTLLKMANNLEAYPRIHKGDSFFSNLGKALKNGFNWFKKAVGWTSSHIAPALTQFGPRGAAVAQGINQVNDIMNKKQSQNVVGH